MVDVLKGKKAGEILLSRIDAANLDLFVSKKNAAATGITVSEDVLKSAKEVQE